MADDAAFPTGDTAFGPPSGASPFDDVDQTAQQTAQVQQGVEQNRSRRNYIESVAKGAASRAGATRSSVTGEG